MQLPEVGVSCSPPPPASPADTCTSKVLNRTLNQEGSHCSSCFREGSQGIGAQRCLGGTRIVSPRLWDVCSSQPVT